MNEMRYASAWNRFVGYMVDGVIMNIFLALLIAAIKMSGAEIETVLSMVFVLFWLVSILYFTIMDASVYRATLGKMLIGIKVADAQSGGRISYLRSFARNIVLGISFIFILPLFVIFFSSKKRMLHDLAVGSVVTDSEAENPGKYLWQRRLVPLLLLLSIFFPAIVGIGYVDRVIGEFMQSAQEEMMRQQTDGQVMVFSGGQPQGQQSYQVTYHAQGNVVFESHMSASPGSGVQQSASWSYSSSDGTPNGLSETDTLSIEPEMSQAEATAKLFVLAKGDQDTDFGAIRLIVKGADVNAKDEQGYTPLYYAVQKHQTEMVKALVFNHARTDLRYPGGMTVWKLAKGDRQMTRALHYADGK